MKITAVLFDLGGVIVRTEYQAPREHLAERLNLSYEDLSHAVFESESARRASLGEITVGQHWEMVAKRLGIDGSGIPALRQEFFAGDVLDRELLALIRSLRPARRTGLISNAWSDLRDYIAANSFQDAFDAILISAEVGLLKPDSRFYKLALERLGASPEGALLIDDSGVNVEAARAMGMAAIQFRDPSDLRAELERHLA